MRVNVESATEVLAVVLCPARAFGPARSAARVLRPIKAAIIRRFHAARSARARQ